MNDFVVVPIVVRNETLIFLDNLENPQAPNKELGQESKRVLGQLSIEPDEI